MISEVHPNVLATQRRDFVTAYTESTLPSAVDAVFRPFAIALKDLTYKDGTSPPVFNLDQRVTALQALKQDGWSLLTTENGLIRDPKDGFEDDNQRVYYGNLTVSSLHMLAMYRHKGLWTPDADPKELPLVGFSLIPGRFAGEYNPNGIGFWKQNKVSEKPALERLMNNWQYHSESVSPVLSLYGVNELQDGNQPAPELDDEQRDLVEDYFVLKSYTPSAGALGNEGNGTYGIEQQETVRNLASMALENINAPLDSRPEDVGVLAHNPYSSRGVAIWMPQRVRS
jgi:hypothetical protein